jgi:hypothetical protein
MMEQVGNEAGKGAASCDAMLGFGTFQVSYARRISVALNHLSEEKTSQVIFMSRNLG